MRKVIALLLLATSAQAASKVAIATGNFTTGATWATASAAAENLSHATTTTVGTGNTDSSTFVLLATAVQQYCVEMASRLITTGTMTVHLRDSTAGTNALSVTVNMSDLPTGGWICFDPGSSTTPGGVDSYLLRATCSNASCATLYVSSGTNLAREVVTTTTGAPAANDVPLITTGFHTGAGTSTSVLVTMDDTSGNSYGSTTPPDSIIIGDIGAWTNGTAASTTYTFKHKGVFNVYAGGQLSIGTSGTRVPSTSTATYTANVASNVDSGWVFSNGSIINAYGATKTVLATKMTADKSAAATVIALTSTSGWNNGDTLAFASTTRTYTQGESKVISTVDNSTQVTLTAGLTNAHSGTSPTQAEVVNLTRNVKFTGTSTSLQGYIFIGNTATVNFSYVETTLLGSSTANKRGIDITTTSSGALTFDSCSFHDSSASQAMGIVVSGSSHSNWNITNSVGYNFSQEGIDVAVSTVTSTWTISGNTFILSLSTSGNTGMFQLSDVQGTFTNNVAAGGWDGINISNTTQQTQGTWSGNTTHSSGRYGVVLGSLGSGASNIKSRFVLTNTTSWRNSNYGVTTGQAIWMPITIDGLTAFGNNAVNLALNALAPPSAIGNLLLKGLVLNGDTTFGTGSGILFVSGSTRGATSARIYNSQLGVASGILTTHSTCDLDVSNTGTALTQIVGSNVTLASSTPVLLATASANGVGDGIQTPALGPVVGINKYGGTTGDHRAWYTTGTAKTDTTAGLFRTASPSARLTPVNANLKLRSGAIYIPIANGTSTATLKAYVRESVSGDGAAYNGNHARLIILENDGAGANYTADYTCATATSAAAGAFELLQCTLPSVTDDAVLMAFIEVDGTAGWVNVSDVAITTTGTGLGNPKYFNFGEMWVGSGVSGTAGGGGGSYTFVQ